MLGVVGVHRIGTIRIENVLDPSQCVFDCSVLIIYNRIFYIESHVYALLYPQVYEGIYRGQKIAIKALESQEPAAMLDAAKKEGGLVWNLRHEHIVKLYGIAQYVWARLLNTS